MQEVYKDVFLQEFPLTGNPLKSINIFVVKSKGEAMIVDTGFNNEEIRHCMTQLINELRLDLSKTVLFLTHLHSDHIGLSSFMEKMGISRIYLSKIDGQYTRNAMAEHDSYWVRLQENAHKQGLDEEHLTIQEHPGFKNRAEDLFSYVPCNAGDTLDIGDFHFEMIDESGHTPGMLGLYERDKKILFCGDHILGKITPNITYWGEDIGDSLGTYLENLSKIKELDIEHLFSSHRFLVDDVNSRIDELKDHHEHRLNETLEIIRAHDRMTIRDITKSMHWDIRTKSWEDFPASQKWFAAGETMAHVVYLRKRGLVKEYVRDDGVLEYSIR